MITLKQKVDCCGCSACSQICPKECISMQRDEQGYLYPQLDFGSCIDCRLCETVCPILHPFEPKLPIYVCGAKNRNEDVRRSSSSGGIFTQIAEYVIAQGGAVFGAAFSDDWQVVHTFAEKEDELVRFRGSKYVQSDINRAYQQARGFLQQGRLVLFSGTPCQILALHRFLKKKYDNLLTVEVACHGVSSPGVWEQYLKHKVMQQVVLDPVGESRSFTKSISSINFRDKVRGWKGYQLTIRLFGSTIGIDQGSSPEVVISTPAFRDPYLLGFIKNVYLRPSCYQCVAKGFRSSADFALADFWSIDRYCHHFNDNKGVTLVAACSIVAKEILLKLNADVIPLSPTKIHQYNRAFDTSASKNALTNWFWEEFPKQGSLIFDQMAERLAPSKKQKWVNKIKSSIKKLILR